MRVFIYRMNKLNRDIRYFYFINSYDMNQHGGGDRQHEIVYRGHKIYYNSSSNIYGDVNTIIIDGGRDAGRRPCFQMILKNKVALLQSIERGTDCFVDRHDNSRDLVLVAFQIAKEKGYSIFELTDNSFKQCPPYRFSLSDVYFLTTGRTWYESILPIKIQHRDESEIIELRKRAHTIKWKTVADYLISKDVQLNFDIRGINENEAGSSMKVLDRIKSMRNTVSCKFFAENTNRILFISNIPSFHGTTWTVNI